MTNTHTEQEDHPWDINIPDHPARTDSPEYVASRAKMNELARTMQPPPYGPPPWQDHHGGALLLKDVDGWFLVKNLYGLEWSSQFCADPAKVDILRVNAKRIYAAFPDAVQELGIQALLDTPITDADGVARWTDSICNASEPLPATLHTGTLPAGSGVHHYPTPITDIMLLKRDDFNLWVNDAQGRPVAVTPVAPRGSGDGRVKVAYATPGSALARRHQQANTKGEAVILPEDHPLAKQAFAEQV